MPKSTKNIRRRESLVNEYWRKLGGFEGEENGDADADCEGVEKDVEFWIFMRESLDGGLDGWKKRVLDRWNRIGLVFLVKDEIYMDLVKTSELENCIWIRVLGFYELLYVCVLNWECGL